MIVDSLELESGPPGSPMTGDPARHPGDPGQKNLLPVSRTFIDLGDQLVGSSNSKERKQDLICFHKFRDAALH